VWTRVVHVVEVSFRVELIGAKNTANSGSKYDPTRQYTVAPEKIARVEPPNTRENISDDKTRRGDKSMQCGIQL
jgi:hypothetical protein